MVKKLANKTTESPRKVSATMPISDMTNKDNREQGTFPRSSSEAENSSQTRTPLYLAGFQNHYKAEIAQLLLSVPF